MSTAVRRRHRCRARAGCRRTRWRAEPGTEARARATPATETRTASGSSEVHLVGVLPPDVDGLADAVRAVVGPCFLARNLCHGLFTRLQARRNVEAVAQENRARDGGGTSRVTAQRTDLAREARGFGPEADAIDPVHGAQKTGHEARGGPEIDLLRCADLLDAALVHDGDGIRHGERLFLVVSYRSEEHT